jgi:phospholipid-binding lipoprotein MlaA
MPTPIANFIGLRGLFLLALTVLTSGCATTRQTTSSDPRDPLESWNRSVYSFNTSLDKALAKPIAKAYVAVAPQPVRTGVSNFLGYLAYPGVVVQDLLQAKPKRFIRDTGRLLVNTTLGIGGLFDPATGMGLVANNEDFGQTLGRRGRSSCQGRGSQ